jgi:hypothetical protein
MPGRTTIRQRVRNLRDDIARTRNPPPVTSDELGMAGRRAAYLVTGDDRYRLPVPAKSVVAGIPHYDRKPLD